MCGACRRVGAVGHFLVRSSPEPEGVGREAILIREGTPRAPTQGTQESTTLSLDARTNKSVPMRD